jgi:hypothetical protein
LGDTVQEQERARYPETMDDETDRALSEVELADIGQTLVTLGQQLIAIGKAAHDVREQPDDIERARNELDHWEFEAYLDKHHQSRQDAIVRTLTGMNSFRRSYSHWERLTVEYALDRMNFTQRRVSTLLGVALGTVNRWAQHPL